MSNTDLEGRIIDERYRLLRKIGEGGMGHVYVGQHMRTQRVCAIKVISRALTNDPEALARFQREATNASQISHPNVASVFDFGETDDGVLYLAMEYVEGLPLSRLIEAEGPLSPARATEIARQIAEGLGAAHELGIVHRDLKPSNIIIAQSRKGGDLAKIVDFGIAKASTGQDQQKLTRTGFVIGTPEYMSPEQLIGDPVDPRTDIYSLGCILYEMLIGEHAFGGATAQVITRRLTEPPPRPRVRRPEIPKALDELVVRALGRSQQERFQTVEEFRAALLHAPAQPITTGPRRLAAWLGWGSAPNETGSTLADPMTPPPTPAHAAAAPIVDAGASMVSESSGERLGHGQLMTPRPTPAPIRVPPTQEKWLGGNSGEQPLSWQPTVAVPGKHPKRLPVQIYAALGGVLLVAVVAILFVLWSTGDETGPGGGPGPDDSTVVGTPPPPPGDPSRTGELRLRNLPAGAVVRVGGREITDDTVTLAADTEYLIEITAPGYAPVTWRGSVAEGETRSWNPRMRPAPE